MALANERNSLDHNVVPCSYYGNTFGGLQGNSTPSSPSPAIGFYSMEGYDKVIFEGAGLQKTCSSIKGNVAPDLIDLHGGESMLGGASSSGDSQSVLEFKSGTDDWAYSSGSLLCFEQGDKSSARSICRRLGNEDRDFSDWADCIDDSSKWNHLSYTTSVDPRLKESMNSFETASGYETLRNPSDKECQRGEERFRWLCSGAVAPDSYLEPGGTDGCFLKRPHLGGDIQYSKKQCTSGSLTRKPKPRPSPSKDPQSVAAKNRRERISERLKILQDLVPNGTKVDLVTMLEKAISYVKFLQLQVKVLATDEFWPAAGGKAPEVAQVKEAIDAILSSYKGTSSSSK